MGGNVSREPFVSCEWLLENLGREDIVVVDCRYDLFDLELGRREYFRGHIPGSYFMDMEHDLTGEIGDHGGRHPLPDVANFVKRANEIGVTDGKAVIAYDRDGSGAARAWWLFNYVGHSRVKILNGGFPMWEALGYPLTTDVPGPVAGDFKPRVKQEILMGMKDLKALKHGTKIVDSRARERYAGVIEPIDRKAGHIPGAINIPYTDVLLTPGLFRKKEEIEELFSASGDEPVVYCGSGVTSCVSFVALWYIGKRPKLYAGSWSDWISYEDNEIATGH